MKIKHFVRQSLFLTALLVSSSRPPFPTSFAETLPSIDARQLEVIPKEISRSGRIYRFRMETGIPRTGNLILVQIGSRPIMAFRVLKTDSVSKEIIAKRIRRYDREGNLELERKYFAAEKIADLVSPPTGESPIVAAGDSQALSAGNEIAPETSDTEESAVQVPADPNAPALLGDDGSGGPARETPIIPGSVEGFDEDLDTSTSPRDYDSGTSPLESSGTSKAGPAVEEREPLIKYEHMAGISVGNFRNMSGFSIPGTTHDGFTAYYNEVIDRELWFHDQSPQDTLSMEFGLGYYSRVNLSGGFDNYDVLPIRAELMYTLQLNPSFAAISHVGAQFNWVFAAENATEAGLATLSGIQPNAGVGLLYNIGPQWYLRADLGLDRMAIGLAVKW